MNLFATILGDLVKEYWNAATSNRGECRLLVPGLTKNIAKDIHHYIKAAGIKSYLVVDSSETPDKANGYILPEGLTSEREGSFVVVTFPGQQAKIQDSIMGSGGVIRSAAFSDEYPWVDKGNEFFRFGKVAERLLQQWGASDDKWLKDCIVTGLVEGTAPSRTRGELLLEFLLGDFKPDSYPSLPNTRQKLLCHCGIPADPTLPGEFSTFKRNVSKVALKIKDRVKDVGARAEVQSNAATLAGGQDLAASVDLLFDGLGGRPSDTTGVLILSNAFNKNIQLWEDLTLKRLQDIFEIELDADLDCTFEANPDRSIVEDGTCATFHGEKIKVFAKYSTTSTASKQILVKHGQKTLTTVPCTENSGIADFIIDTSAITKYSKKVPLSVQLLIGGLPVKEDRLALHLCGENRPAFLLIKAGFKVVDILKGDDIDPQSDSPKVTITSVTQVYGFGGNFKKISIDANDVEHTSVGTDIVGLKQPVDASSYPRLVTAEFSEGTIGVSLETDGKSGGEFTLEDELRVNVIDKNLSKSRKVLAHFEKNIEEQFLGLGLPDETLFRCKLAREFESKSGWEPILVDFNADNRDTAIESTSENIKKVGHLATPGIPTRPITAHPDISKLIDCYAGAREKLIKAVSGNLKIPLDRPVYAAMPIYIKETSEHIEALICSYTEAYVNILSYMDKQRGNLDWATLFRLCYIDSVVFWPSNAEIAKFSLLGPWHPLVVCKRFMVQKALYQGATKLARDRSQWIYNQLAVLLDRVEGARWFFTLESNSTSFSHGCIAASSDPGWLFCLRVGAGQTIDNQGFADIGNLLHRNLGLEIEVDRFAGIGSIQHHMRAFTRAFPSKRAISLCLPKGYDEGKILEDARNLFSNLVDGQATELGNLLPGGARFYFETGRLKNTPTFEWRNPPVIAYECENITNACSQNQVDIGFLPPTQKVSFSPLDVKGCSAVRGENDSSVFSAPLLSTSQGHDGTPNSKIIENEPLTQAISFGDIGESFGTLLGGVLKLTPHPLISVKSLGLPSTLNSEWVIVSGAICDPAVFVKYICNETGQDTTEKALWEYKINIGRRMDSYFILSRIPPSLRASLWENGKAFVSAKENLPKVVRSLGEVGIAIGNEVMRSGKHALGILGQVAAIRLFLGSGDSSTGILKKDTNTIGFLLQVDSFRELFGDSSFSETGTKSRADLLAVQISLPNGGSKMKISLCGIECKYVSGIFNQPDEAFEQALETYNQAKNLLLAAKEGVIERLALLRLIGFGLRMVSAKQNVAPAKEALILSALLRGEYELDEAGVPTVVVSSESELTKPELNGSWVRVCPGHWPGINSTDELKAVTEKLSKKLFPGSPGDLGANTHASSTSGKATPKQGQESPKPTPNASPAQPAQAPVAVAAGGASINADAHKVGLKITVGKALGGQEQEFSFWPSNVELTQLNVGIIGDLGTGKTQLIKSLIYQLGAHPELNRDKKPKFLILDYKGDYIKPDFAEAIGAKILEPHHIPLNPFDVSASKNHNPRLNRALFFIDMLKKIYRNIGPVQIGNLRTAIEGAYQAAERRGSAAPTIKQIHEGYTRAVPRADSASNILQLMEMSMLFEEDQSKITSFSSLMDNGVVVLSLSTLGQQDELKNMLVTIFLNFYYDYMLGIQKQPFTSGDPSLRFIDSLLLVDEANSIMQYEFPVLKNLLLQGREFGVGVLLASQYLSHFNTSNEKYTESLLTWFIHRVNDVRASELERLGLQQANAATLASQVKALKQHQCLYRSLGVDGKIMTGIPFYKLMEARR